MAKNVFSQKTRHHFGLQERLGAMFISLVLLTGLTIALIGYHVIHKVEVSLTNELAGNISQTVLHEVQRSAYDPVPPFINAVAHGALPRARTIKERLELLPILHVFMDSYSIMETVKVGYENGAFFSLRRLFTKEERLSRGAPENAVYLVTNQEPAGRGFLLDRFYYDANMELLHRATGDRETGYDPRKRPWYETAMKTTDPVESDPYITATSKQPSVTVSLQSLGGNAVVGVDIALTELSQMLRTVLPTPGSRISLFKEDGTLIANTVGVMAGGSNDIRMRTRDDLTEAVLLGLRRYEEGSRGLDMNLDAEGQMWVLFLEEVVMPGAIHNFILITIPRGEILKESAFFKRYVAFAAAGLLIATVSASWLAVRFIFRPLRKLASRAQNLQECPFGQSERIVSGVEEIDALSQYMEQMQGNMQKLFSLAYTINGEKDPSKLLRQVLREAISLSDSDGGIVSLLDENGKVLSDGVTCWIDEDGTFRYYSLDHTQVKLSPLVDGVLKNNKLRQECVASSDQRSKVSPLLMGFDDPDVAEMDLLCLPLNGRMGEKLGIFGLARKVRSGEEKFQPQQIALADGLGKIVAIALDNRRLLEKQRALLDAVIQIVAGAIDAKSPYTGGHCERVPILFQMMLQAACDEQNGVFKDFSLDDDGWEEARLAAWLHDWGKVTTPEYVMDKATKLETMYDRIHEIRTRFEVLKRDAEISCLRAILGGNDVKAETGKLQTALRQLDDDFAFVARCNRGDERLEEGDLDRLRQIGSRTWIRTLDKTLGVSRDERGRMEQVAGLGLPAVERLLDDKPEHIIERNGTDAIVPDNPWGFRIETPQYLYNRGELHNLSIRAGTLTAEERYKINDHMTQTIVMLDKVPLPKHLRNVPEIAGAHHETMDGKGYPRRLVREEMSWSARMMAVADIFEALTASDRPYKSSKTLSEALEIMEEFKRKNHIDEDVYELFLNADIPQKYAKLCLKPEQNDMAENIPFFWYPAS